MVPLGIMFAFAIRWMKKSNYGTTRVPDNLTQEERVLKFGLVGVRSKEDTPSDLIAFREWEAALIFDNLRYSFGHG